MHHAEVAYGRGDGMCVLTYPVLHKGHSTRHATHTSPQRLRAPDTRQDDLGQACCNLAGELLRKKKKHFEASANVDSPGVILRICCGWNSGP